jgi:hypothetical protein
MLCQVLSRIASASIVVNGQELLTGTLENPGLLQGTPLSPILLLFYNADLVSRAINENGGSTAFVDDYTVWATGSSATVNNLQLNETISKAVAWEKRIGATFEGEKTAFIHFTRTESRANEAPLTVKDQVIKPSKSIKLLGVIFDAQVRFREQVQRAVSRGTRETLALCRMTTLLPATARQLFNATVAPVVEYASTVWAHASAAAPRFFNTIQKMGAKAVTRSFITVAREVAEAEASL